MSRFDGPGPAMFVALCVFVALFMLLGMVIGWMLVILVSGGST